MGSQQQQVIQEVEVTVLSAQDLKNVKRMGGSMDPYCVVWLHPHLKVAGAVSKGGGANPTWNSTITLPLLLDHDNHNKHTVTVEIYHHGRFSNKLVGSAAVSVDLSTAETGSSKSNSYQVRKKSGKPQGVLNVAVKVGKAMSEAEAAKYAAPAMGVPAMASQQHFSYNQPQQYYPQAYSQHRYHQQAPPRRSSMMGRPGMGLGAGLLGGVLLGSALDGGGGCGGGCGG